VCLDDERGEKVPRFATVQDGCSWIYRDQRSDGDTKSVQKRTSKGCFWMTLKPDGACLIPVPPVLRRRAFITNDTNGTNSTNFTITNDTNGTNSTNFTITNDTNGTNSTNFTITNDKNGTNSTNFKITNDTNGTNSTNFTITNGANGTNFTITNGTRVAQAGPQRAGGSERRPGEALQQEFPPAKS